MKTRNLTTEGAKGIVNAWLFNGSCVVIVAIAVFTDLRWAHNLVIFLSWACLLGGIGFLAADEPIESSKLPRWAARLAFLLPMTLLVMEGWFFCGAAIGFAYICGEVHRSRFNNPHSAIRDPQSNE